MKIYNGDGMILGRLASRVAKDALLGEEVHVVNAENIVISGQKVLIVAREKQRRERKAHPTKSARFSRLPERAVRRSIRGMLPWKQARGKEAFKRIMCHRGVPEAFAGKELLTVLGASAQKLPNLKFITMGEICKRLGWKQP
ncbi:MAG: 50S ribosomal protein L13 [Nanoarchaeota archaeon]|nr:50S ribosomal protein L13 [Nanoarchaeota archaeon]